MTRRVLRSPLVWVGGKARLLDWLLPQLDVPCALYAEPFGGSASVLLNRAKSAIEVYNDLDGALVTFLLCVKHHPAELERAGIEGWELLAVTSTSRGSIDQSDSEINLGSYLHERFTLWFKRPLAE